MELNYIYMYECMCMFWRRRWHPTPVLLPGKPHGWRSLVGCSPWDRKESDMTERLHFHFSLSCTGEGNGNPLQCSCLENPRNGGAWWAAACGVAQSQTQWSDLVAAAACVCFVYFRNTIFLMSEKQFVIYHINKRKNHLNICLKYHLWIKLIKLGMKLPLYDKK